MTINNPNSVQESDELDKRKKNTDIKSKFLREFTRDFINTKRTSRKNNIIDEILNNDSIESSPTLKREIASFKAMADDKDLQNFDESKINIFDLRRAISKEAMSLENSRSNYIEYIYSSYDLDDKQKKILKKEVKKQSQRDLENFLSSENKNNKFLKKTLGKIPTRMNKLPFLESLSIDEIKDRFKNVKSEEKESLEEALRNLSTGRFYDLDIKILFNSGFLTQEEKKQVINTFIPYITLKQALELGLESEQNLNKKKEKILKNLLSKKGINHRVDEIIENTSLSDIKIKSSIFFDDEENLDKIADEIGFYNIEKDYKKFIEEAKDEIIKNGPQTLDELKTILSTKEFEGKINGIENMKENSILKIEKVGNTGEKQVIYSRVESINNENKKFLLRGLGGNSSGKEIINFSSESAPDSISFVDFLENVKKFSSISFFDEEDLKKKIEKKEIDIETSDFHQYTKDEIRKNPELKSNLKDEYLKYREDELDILRQELESIDEQISDIEGSKEKKELKNRLDNLKTKKELIKTKISSLENKSGDNIDDDELIGLSNFYKLKEKIDSIDSEGSSLGLEKGVFLKTKDSKGFLHEIIGVDLEKGTILLRTGKEEEELSFEEFYQAFDNKKAQRIKAIKGIEELLEENISSGEKADIWKKYEVSDGELKIKELPEYSIEKDKTVEYFVSDKSDEIYKLEEISGNRVVFRFGERKKINSLDEKERKKYKKNVKLGKDGKPERNSDGSIKYHGELISLSNDSYEMSLTEFNNLINRDKEEFYPDWQLGKKETLDNPQNLQNDFHGKFSTKLFNNFSIAELMQAGKLLTEGVEEYLKKGNDIHAAKMALAMGKLLPEEVRGDLLIKVERSEQEAMDKEVESLGKVDSWIATKRIETWLLNKDTPEYKKEAGLMFMIQKYGHLTTKSGLAKYRGKFLWYEAFGGRIGDDFFIEMQKEAEDSNKTFSEEYLMYIFVKKQCGGGGYKGIRRRTRLHKEYKKAWPNDGIKGEFETGYNDASDERTARAMVDGGINEMKGGTTTNALGWFKKAVERGGTLEEMNEGFFTLLYSGAIYNIDQKSYLELKNMWSGDSMPVIMARFSSYKTDMDLFNETVLKLSKRIGEEYSEEFPNIYKDAKEIYNMAIPPQKGEEKDRIEKTQAFWHKYGTPLSRALNMNHRGNTKYSKTDKTIILEKEKDATFGKYFDSVRAFTSVEDGFGDGFMKEEMGQEGIAGLNTNEAIKKYFTIPSSRGFNSKNISIIENVWGGISSDVNSIKGSDFSGGENDKRKYLRFILRDVLAGLRTNHGDASYLALYADLSPTKDDFDAWGINGAFLKKLKDFSSETILDGTDEEFNRMLEDVVDTILSGGNSNSSGSYSTGFEKATEDISEHVKNLTPEKDDNTPEE